MKQMNVKELIVIWLISWYNLKKIICYKHSTKKQREHNEGIYF